MKIRFLLVFFSALVFNLHSSTVFAAPRKIVASAEQVFDEKIPPGTVITFPNGRKYTINAFLGSGNTTAVYSIKENPKAALRLPMEPLKAANRKGMVKPADLMNMMSDGSSLLKESKVSHTAILDALASCYLLVEKLPEDAIGFGEIMTSKEFRSPDREKAIKVLFKELEKMAYLKIGDLGVRQIQYSPSKGVWILNDWTDVRYLSPDEMKKELAERQSDSFFKNYEIPGEPEMDALSRVWDREPKLVEKYETLLWTKFKDLKSKPDLWKKQAGLARTSARLSEACGDILPKVAFRKRPAFDTP